MTKSNKNLISGIIKRHADGFGFLIPDNPDHPDVYIPKHFMTGIMTNDRVSADVFKSRGKDRYHGEIAEVISRGTKTLVGKIERLNDQWFIVPDESKGWGQDLKIAREQALTAKDGELVQVEILTYPGEGTTFNGKVIEVIGDAEDPLNDIKRVLRGQNIPVDFSKPTHNEVAGLKADPQPGDWKNRVNLMDLPLITIDGATAKDFDDAVFVDLKDTGFRLVVAIADVSYYVKPGTSLDRDAYERGTSVYFPNYVVPMLPEILSNGLCSLKPNVPRLCMVADMTFDFQGELQSSKFYEAVMKSQARVTYGEAQEIIDGTTIEKFNHVKTNILRCSDLAKLLMARRFRDGSLDLNISQTELEIDASGNPIDVQKSERLFAHRLIEELMLAANVAVAQFIEQKEKGGIYRIHEDPSPEAIKTLELYLHNLGSNIRLSGGLLQKKLSKALEHFANHAEGQIINILTLRSLSQAKYSSSNIGHFGLGFASYTHFTSPIRRYPDLIVHRLLKHHVVSAFSYPMPEEDDLATAANILSSTEQRAVKCERQFMSIKKARFIERFVGKEFVGMVSSVARFGVFVLLREFDIDGLVKLENLGDDRWVFDEDNLRIMGDRSNTIFKLGQMLKVTVTSVDVELGQINFDLNEEHKVVRRTPYGKKTAGDSRPSRGDKASRHRFKEGGKKDRDHKRSGRGSSDRKESDRKGSGYGTSSSKDISHKNSRSTESTSEKYQSKDAAKSTARKPLKRIFEQKDSGKSKEQTKEQDRKSFDKKAESRKSKPEEKAPGRGFFKPFSKEKPKVGGLSREEVIKKLDALSSEKEGSQGANHRNRKNSGKNSQKRGKTKNNSGGVR